MTIDMLTAPFPQLKFVVSGGITPDNLKDYLQHPKVICGAGTWIAPPELLEAKQYDRIARRAKDAAKIVQTARIGL